MKVRLITYTASAESVVAVAAKLCYSDMSVDRIIAGISDEDVASMIHRLIGSGHLSPLEHANFTFAIEDVSRSMMAQITRHRVASFSVQSQRYVTMENASMIVPPAILESEDALSLFNECSMLSLAAYKELTAGLAKRYVQDGMDVKAAQKKAQEDARFVLPNACATRMIVTMNARELRHFFSLRCCNRAQWEIRQVADEMLRQVREVAPNLFEGAGPACVSEGKCSEGAMCCGHPRSKDGG